MKVLFVSNLFPDATQTIRGLDNARLLRHLTRWCEVRVVACRPVPWLWPFGRLSQTPCRREDESFQPIYVPTPYIPKVGSRWNHRLMARALRRGVRQVRRQFPFDVVMVSWLYPDGCAVAKLAMTERFSFIAIAQGSDAHQYLKMPVRRRVIVDALTGASAVVARSGELKRNLTAAGLPETKVHAIYNGVDFSLYRPADKQAVRISLGLPPDSPVILYVGNFFPIKNPLLAVAAHAVLSQTLLPTARLVMLGDGPLLPAARLQADRGLAGARVELPGRRPPSQVAKYMQAADVLCVPSHNEGVPNVILEAFACGLPVVATRVGGIPEVLNRDFLGRLVEPASASALAAALSERLNGPANPEEIAQHAQQFSWEKTAQAHVKLLEIVREQTQSNSHG